MNVLSVLGLQLLLLHFGMTESALELIVVTVATKHNDAFARYMMAADNYGYKIKVCGMGEEWRGGDLAKSVGGAQKINILKRDLAQYADREDVLLMFTDSYDTILTRPVDELIKQFLAFKSRVVISAEGFIWPDRKLAPQYEQVPSNQKRYLCSGGYIGYAREFVGMLNHETVGDKFDDQLYFTRIYLDKAARAKYDIKLDHKSEIFQNLHGAIDDINLEFHAKETLLRNELTQSHPAVVHGNGPIKSEFTTLANYLGGAYGEDGCVFCHKNKISLSSRTEAQMPLVLVSITIDMPTAFLGTFFKKITALEYPKIRMQLYIHNMVPNHENLVTSFVRDAGQYAHVDFIKAADKVDMKQSRNTAIEIAQKRQVDFYFFVHSEAQIDNPKTLKVLIEQNRNFTAPLFVRPAQLYSNFWGALNDQGFYSRSFDYSNIVNRKIKGLWAVPYVHYIYLVSKTVLRQLHEPYTYDDMDPDMAFCSHLREMYVLMYVTNEVELGHLTSSEEVDLHAIDETSLPARFTRPPPKSRISMWWILPAVVIVLFLLRGRIASRFLRKTAI